MEDIRSQIIRLTREVSYHARCAQQYADAATRQGMPDSFKLKPLEHAEWHRQQQATKKAELDRLEAMDRFVVYPTTRANAGGNLYEVRRLYSNRKAGTETPTHSEALAQAEADRLNAVLMEGAHHG